MKNIILLLLAFAFSVSVNAQPPNVPADKGATFGEKITTENAMTTEQMLNLLALNERPNKLTEVKVKATVTDVCKMEGCWLKIQSASGDIMVKLKDHEFLVPVAISGKNVVIAGMAEEKITSVEMLRHYAADAGKSKEDIAAITQPKKEVTITATGILVL